MKNNYQVIDYKNKKYIVAITKKNEPFVIDYEDLSAIPDKSLYVSNGHIYCSNSMLLQRLVMDAPHGTTVDHINRIKTDNRAANLQIVSQSARNQTKKKRTVTLPANCGVSPEEIPTLISYRSDKGKGGAWVIEIKKDGKKTVLFKTTTTVNVTDKTKFEMVKKKMRLLLATEPELFAGHCMNGDLSTEGEKLEREYIEIMELAGFTVAPRQSNPFLAENLDGMSTEDIECLELFDGTNASIKGKKPAVAPAVPAVAHEVPVKAQIPDASYEDIINALPREQLLDLMGMKCKSADDGKKQFYAKYPEKLALSKLRGVKKAVGEMTIVRGMISKLWKGELALGEDITSLQEYKDMVKKDVSGPRK